MQKKPTSLCRRKSKITLALGEERLFLSPEEIGSALAGLLQRRSQKPQENDGPRGRSREPLETASVEDATRTLSDARVILD